MKAVAGIAKEILGLFVDDQGLALTILGVVAAALLIAFALHTPAIAGAMLAVGCLAALLVSTLRARPRG